MRPGTGEAVYAVVVVVTFAAGLDSMPVAEDLLIDGRPISA